MAGEGKSKVRSKKREKVVVEVGFDSGDDEPIGSFLKLKSKRKAKRVKAGSDGSGDKGKGIEEVVVNNEDLAGMDDTLASFRKRLRVPKKDGGSVAKVGRSLVSDVAEPSGQSLDECVDVGDVALEPALNSVNKVHGNGDGGFDQTPDEVVKEGSRRKSKRPKVALVPKEVEGEHISEYALPGQRSGSVPSPSEGDCAFSCLNDNLDDSLSAFIRKAQSGVTKKVRGSSRVKAERDTHAHGGENVSSAGVAEDPPAAPICQSTCSLKMGKTSASFSENLHAEQEGTIALSKGSDDIFLPVSNSYHENISCSESSLRPCSNEITNAEVTGCQHNGDANGSPIEPAGSNHFLDERSDEILDVRQKPYSVCNQRRISKDIDKLNNDQVRRAVDDDKHDMTTPLSRSEQGKKSHFGKYFPTAKAGKSIPDPKACSMSVENIEKSSLDEKELSKQLENVPHSSIDPLSMELQASSACKAVLVKPFDGLDTDLCLKDCTQAGSDSSFALDAQQKHPYSSDCDGAISIQDGSGEELDKCPVNFQEGASLPDGRLSPLSLHETSKHELTDQMQCQEKSPEKANVSISVHQEVIMRKSAPLTDLCSSVLLKNQISHETSGGECLPIHEEASDDEEADGSSSPIISDHFDSPAEDLGLVPNHESENKRLSDHQRAARSAKKRRHLDMAYEGDVDWEILLHQQEVRHQFADCDQPFKSADASLSVFSEAENGAAAAVSVGLKARSVGPIEKIKFKEVLKRKGGLQEYLECRNHILSLWSKDISRLLPLSECGVHEAPSVDESSRTSLVRNVYNFLDQCGYINFGVASEKDKEENGGGHNLKLVKEENFGGKTSNRIGDTEDGVSFILGKVKISDTVALEKNDLASDIDKGAARPEADSKPVDFQAMSSPTVPVRCTPDNSLENGIVETKPLDRRINVDSSGAMPLSEGENGTALPLGPLDLSSSDEATLDGVSIIPSELCKVSSDLQSISVDDKVHEMQFDSKAKKRIIVVGAGPAGLTAARHMQRQGFHVTVLEARSRIGGRVFTDRTALSVPVDLGASIITGVEADVATERRADPSSLICAQLGIELTVLNSDCPLYDSVTGQRVPADLDEALEAEYNGLLDDMILLVAQKGEHAMRMSLEEGLEYALKKRRMARSRRNYAGYKSMDMKMGDGKLPADEATEDATKAETLNPLERRVMDWHFANLEYGCAALLKEVSLPYWNQDDVYGGFGGAHCMIKGGYSAVVDSLAGGICIHLNHVVTDISYCSKNCISNDEGSQRVKVSTSNGCEFEGDAVLITVPLGCLKADTIKFSPPLPRWKSLSIERLGFGVLNKVVLEFPEVFWDDNLDYFGATAEETNLRGQCFMFWNVKKTVGAPVLIALVVGKAAIEDKMSPSDHINHALVVLRKLFGQTRVPDPVASVVTDWGRDPYSYGAYSYVAVGSSGEDYDILGRPVDNCLFFAGEATCKEHPDTVGGAMMSGLREAVRIIDLLSTGVDHTAEIEAVESAESHSDLERTEVRDIITRLEAVELSNVLCKNSLDRAQILTRERLLRDMFLTAKTTAGRLHLVKELLTLPVNILKSFAGTRKGLSTLNSWILDSMGKDGTQLLRHCVRLLVRVSTDLLAVRLSGIGKTVKEKVCVHTSRDIRAIASQLVNVWVEIFRKEKYSNGKLKLLRLSTAGDSLKNKNNTASGKPPLRMNNHASAGSQLTDNSNKVNTKPGNVERTDSKSEVRSSSSQGSAGKQHAAGEGSRGLPMSEEEKAALAAAEAARAAALAAAKAYASSGAKYHTPQQLPKIPSFHKFARREQYARMDDADIRRNWSGGATLKQDCLSEIDSRNCRVRDWSVDFSAAAVNLDSSRMSFDNHSQRSHSNEMASQMNFREHSGESAPMDTSLFTKAWVDSSGSVEGKDYNAIERWQCQAAAANFEFYQRTLHVTDEEDSNMGSSLPTSKQNHFVNESSASQVTVNKELVDNQPRGPESIKQGVVDYVASLLMPLYKARKVDKEGYKIIMKKTATKVMERTTDAEKAMSVTEFLDFKRKNKIRALVDKLIEKHMAKPG